MNVELIGGPFDGEIYTTTVPGEMLVPGSVLRIGAQVYQLSSVPHVPLAHYIGSEVELRNA